MVDSSPRVGNTYNEYWTSYSARKEVCSQKQNKTKHNDEYQRDTNSIWQSFQWQKTVIGQIGL